MKKLFTLALALSVAFAGFAQVQKVARKDVKNIAAQEQAIIGEEVFENVGNAQNMMTRWDSFNSTELDYTTCDWQTNTAAKNWTMHFPDGCLGFTWIASFETDYSDRGTGIGIYNPNTDEWSTSNGLIEDHKTGFGTAARYKDNGIVVVSRNPATYTCEVYIIDDKDNLPTNSLSPIYVMPGGQSEYNLHFPTVMCTGPDHDHIHILVTSLNMNVNGQDNPYYYFRSLDGGNTWDELLTIDYLGRDYAPCYGSGSDAYFMENMGGNELNIVVNTGRGDGAVLTSTDDGNTWTRTVYYHNPGIDVDFGEAVSLYPRWTSAFWDSNRTLHVAYEWNGRTGDPTSTSYYPGMGGVAYWNSIMPYKGDGSSAANGFDPTNPMPPVQGQPFIMDSAYLYNDIYASWWLWGDAPHEMWSEYIGYPTPLDENEQPLLDPYQAEEFNMYDHGMSNHGHYNGGVCEMPVLMTTGDMIVAVWMSLDDHHLTCGQTNDLILFKLFSRASYDNGATWTPMIQLTDDFMYQYTEFVYPQAAIDPINNQLVVVVQTDGDPDTYLIGSGGDGDPLDNLFTALTFDLYELFGYDAIGEGPMHNNTIMEVYPNPASESMTLTLNQEENVVISNVMGQTVSSFKGNAGINRVDVSSLSSGIYFISAGSATQKFIVK